MSNKKQKEEKQQEPTLKEKIQATLQSAQQTVVDINKQIEELTNQLFVQQGIINTCNAVINEIDSDRKDK